LSAAVKAQLDVWAATKCWYIATPKPTIAARAASRSGARAHRLDWVAKSDRIAKKPTRR
jgi:hypothetical protein